MDERVERLKTPEECDQYAKKLRDLLRQVHRRAVELRAASHDSKSEVEHEALKAVYAYEEVLAKKHDGKRVKASRTWQMINRHGLVEAVERAVNRKNVTTGYTTLLDMGLHDYAFELIVLRHPDQFSKEAVERSRERVAKWEKK